MCSTGTRYPFIYNSPVREILLKKWGAVWLPIQDAIVRDNPRAHPLHFVLARRLGSNSRAHFMDYPSAIPWLAWSHSSLVVLGKQTEGPSSQGQQPKVSPQTSAFTVLHHSMVLKASGRKASRQAWTGDCKILFPL